MKDMKSIYNIYVSAVTVLLLMWLGVAEAQAQEAVMVRGVCKVKLVNKASEKKNAFTEEVYYLVVPNIGRANEIKNRIEQASKGDLAKTIERLNKIKHEYDITDKTKANGVIPINVQSGMAYVVFSENYGQAGCFEVKAGQREYELRIEVVKAVEVNIHSEYRLKPLSYTIEPDNGEEHFRMQIPIDTSLIKKSSRLVLQTYAIDCMTEDTVAYCTPIIYDAREYHGLQDKRMDFDFMKNDKLAFGYAVGGIPAFIDTTIIFRKPDITRTYRGASRYAIEDYHHVCFDGNLGGSCLRIRPFKFLDFSVAIPEMELTDEFHDNAETVVERKRSNLRLKFVQGKDVLTTDSINDVERNNIVKELEKYKDNLVEPTIIGTASPEGSEKINRELAEKRARVARNFISQHLPRRTLSVKTRIYTWEDVAEELTQIRRLDEAQAVRAAIASNSSNKLALDRAIAGLPFYETMIVPIMENMRVMQCSYGYIARFVMSADEAVEVYYRDKKEFLSGKKNLSSGDYYNLYANITDTVELDTVTMMAYNWLKQKPLDDMYGQNIAPYVYYRMARLMQRHGTPDTLLLAPFINDSVGIDVRVNKFGMPIKMNRADIFVAQAMNYYQLQKFGKAKGYIQYLEKKGKSVPGLDKLQMFMTLKDKFGQDENDPEFVKARNFILGSSNENKAILYTEVPEWRVSFENTDSLINLLDDSNPKKWYLKGILWSSRYNKEPDLSEYYADDTADDGSFKPLSAKEEEDLALKNYQEYMEYQKKLTEYNEAHKDDVVEEPVDITDIKHYLAYFHHSFALEPTFKRYYYNEGHVDDDMRKKHKYLKKDFAGYDEVFKLLKRRDDRLRAEQQGGYSNDIPDAAASAGNDDTSAGNNSGSAETSADENK